jgi:hypothetical protein
VFVNDIWVVFPASNWSNVTKILNTTSGLLIRYKWYANDSTDLWGESGIYSFITTMGIGLTITAFDERTLAPLMFNVTITNATSTFNLSNQNTTVLAWNETGLPLGSVRISISSTGYSAIPRNYYTTISPAISLNLVAYLLADAVGIYDTFVVIDYNGNPIQGALITVNKLIGSAYVAVEQETTDSAGSALFFLDPSTTYQVLATASGYLFAVDVDGVPQPWFYHQPNPRIQPTYIHMLRSGGTAQNLFGLTTLFGNVTFLLLPEEYIHNQSFLISFTILDSAGELQWYGMTVVYRNSTNTTIVNTSNLTAPSGATLLYTTSNQSGFYDVYTWFKKTGFDEYDATVKTYVITNSTGFGNVGAYMLSWSMLTLQLIALLITIMVVGFMARFSMIVAGAIGLACLAMFCLVGFFSWIWWGATVLVYVSVVALRTYL